MYTPDNLAYDLQDTEDLLYEDQDILPPYPPDGGAEEPQYDLDSQIYEPGRQARNRRRRRRKAVRRTLTVSILTLSLAAGAGLHILWTQSDTILKISSPAFFSRLDARETSSSDNAAQDLTDGGIDAAGTQEGSLHIASVSDDWNLILVNPWNPVPEDYDVDLVPIQYGGQYVDSRCYVYLQNMLDDCSSAGLYPLICSSYRTQEKQQQLFDERTEELTAQGYSLKDAKAKAATSVAKPGTSEHQLGLAVDIVDKNHQLLDSSQENTLVQQWLMENSWKYGFILRYPNGTSSLTGIIYEPWHYRYVGKEAAKEIYDRGICLEEYLQEQM